MAENTTPAQQQYPNLNPYASTNGTSELQQPSLPQATISNSDAHQTASASSTNNMQSLSNGPVAEKARAEADITKNELSNLASSRTTPSNTTATGQKLTHYHSFFYELLSWSNPRASAIAYVALVTLIFATRYMPLVRYFLKGTYIILGITAAAEIAGRMVMGEGFATKIRPKRYYTIPRETLESIMEDLVELGNFFVIEFQRVVFAENVEITIGTFLTALITYFLIKITPAWGLALLFTTFAFFTPLIYIKNQPMIDQHLANASDLINQQATQVRDLANQHAGKAMEASQSALKDYSAKASEMMGTAKKTAVEKGYVAPETAAKVPGGSGEGIKKEDLPAAPTVEPVAEVKTEEEHKEPLVAA